MGFHANKIKHYSTDLTGYSDFYNPFRYEFERFSSVRVLINISTMGVHCNTDVTSCYDFYIPFSYVYERFKSLY